MRLFYLNVADGFPPSLLQSVLLKQKTISLTRPRSATTSGNLPSEPVWQVFSDPSATALMRVPENSTHLSLSRILSLYKWAIIHIYTESYFIIFELNKRSLIGRFSV